jgi:AbiV family abortive infection protein
MSKDKKFPALTVIDIARGMIECRTSVRELLRECELLAQHGMFARSYALAHTACEEIAKFYILELAGKRSALGDPPVWRLFWQRFRAHESKITQLNVRLLLLSEECDAAARTAIESAEGIFNYGLTPRNLSLYVDVGPEGAFRKPSDISGAGVSSGNRTNR